MNLNFRSVFNEQTGTWVAVSEIVAAKGKRSRAAMVVAASTLIGYALTGGQAQAQLFLTESVTPSQGNTATAGLVGLIEAHNYDTNTTVESTFGGYSSIVGGSNNKLLGKSEVVFGVGNTDAANSADNVVYGVANKNSGVTDAVQVGNLNVVNNGGGFGGGSNITLGSANTAAGYYAYAIGTFAKAANDYAIAFGTEITATGLNSIAMGQNARATASGAIAIGSTPANASTGQFKSAQAQAATGVNSIALGQLDTASGVSAVAIGTNSTASGDTSIAFGCHWRGCDSNRDGSQCHG